MTIKEIAQLAGVSISTVSRVINNSGYVNVETKEKVLRIIKEYNYEPSLLAQALSKQENTTIGVVIPEIDNEFFGEILAGINDIIEQENLSMICSDTNNSRAREEKALRTLSQQKVRGLIIAPALDASTELRRQLETLNIPTVILDRHIQASHWDGVYFDNFKSTYTATNILIKEGYQRIGIITGDMLLQLGRERYEGYVAALEEENMILEQKYVYHGDFSIETAYRIANEMFQSGDMPEAIVTSNNRTSIGLIRAARENNIQLGKDLAVIGVDHIMMLDMLGYPFSCITRDSRLMGREVVKLLLQNIKDPSKSGRTALIMPAEIRLKGSEKRTTEFFNYVKAEV